MVDTLQKMGQITFEFVGNTELMEVHIFRTDSFQGDPTESDGRNVVGSGRVMPALLIPFYFPQSYKHEVLDLSAKEFHPPTSRVTGDTGWFHLSITQPAHVFG